MRETHELSAILVGFAAALRAAGVAADAQRVQTMIVALDQLDVLDPADVYWAGRLTLCAGRDDLARYDRCFAAYFSGETARPQRRPPPVPSLRPAPQPGGTVPATDQGAGEATADPRLTTASTAEVLRHRDVARLTASERVQVHRLIALLDTARPLRRSRRFTPAPRGRIDPHRSVRTVLRRGGELSALRYRTHRRRARRVVLLIDVSGSMSPYAEALLRFAHAALRAAPRTTEVFSAGTRLTTVTRALRHRDADTAMAAASAAIPDWSGGTRLGEELKEFLDRFGHRGLARGATVVIASDGWERGDASLLGEQMARLHRLAHYVVWANPHKARPGYQPLTAGMSAALPHIDAFVAGHSLGALEQLARVIGEGPGTGRQEGSMGPMRQVSSGA